MVCSEGWLGWDALPALVMWGSESLNPTWTPKDPTYFGAPHCDFLI